MKARIHDGSSFQSFLNEEGVQEETEAIARERVTTWKAEQEVIG